LTLSGNLIFDVISFGLNLVKTPFEWIINEFINTGLNFIVADQIIP
jgi:hypothetical protein